MVRIQALVNGLDRLFPLILRAFNTRRRIYLHSDRKRQRGMRFFRGHLPCRNRIPPPTPIYQGAWQYCAVPPPLAMLQHRHFVWLPYGFIPRAAALDRPSQMVCTLADRANKEF